MNSLPYFLIAIPCALVIYAFLVYPMALKVVSLFKPPPRWSDVPTDLPSITITIPCYNEERSIAATIESILALDYPSAKRQILIISDASSDGTDEIVRGYTGRGVELLRLPARGGKTAAENAAAIIFVATS